LQSTWIKPVARRLEEEESTTGPATGGGWLVDTAVSDSDRRIKKNILPLQRTLQRSREQVQGLPVGSTHADKQSSVSWVLRELRPVSFTIKAGIDSKKLKTPDTRFGFVAQELERVIPDLVEHDGCEAGYHFDDVESRCILDHAGMSTASKPESSLSVRYQDLIAVLTLAFKEQQTQMTRQDLDVTQAQEEVMDLLDAADKLDMVLDQFEATGMQLPERRSVALRPQTFL